jgi:hypothetical protein
MYSTSLFFVERRIVALDAAGKERVRLEGYLPNNDFMAPLPNGLGRIAFVQKKYADAEGWYGRTRYLICGCPQPYFFGDTK